MCVSKDANFIKGYYRLATAQTELHLYDDAISTLTAALVKEPSMSPFRCSVSAPSSNNVYQIMIH
jgi:hypothetical protein